MTEQDRPVFTIVEQNYCLTTNTEPYKSRSVDILHHSTMADRDKSIDRRTDKENSDDRGTEIDGTR